MTKADKQNWAGVAILSVLLHVLLATFHFSGPGGTEFAHYGDGAGAVVICSGGIARTVIPGDGNSTGDAPASVQIVLKCPMCSVAGTCAATLNSGSVIAFDPPAIRLGTGQRSTAPNHNELASNHSARGPPTLV